MGIAELVKELGLGIAMVLVVIYLLFKLGQWAADLVKDTITDLKKQRDSLVDIIKGFNVVLKSHNEHAQQFGRETKEGFGHMRREHADLLKIGEEQTKVLTRINGFKKGEG